MKIPVYQKRNIRIKSKCGVQVTGGFCIWECWGFFLLHITFILRSTWCCHLHCRNSLQVKILVLSSYLGYLGQCKE